MAGQVGTLSVRPLLPGNTLGQPFDIHTGGIDFMKFPHHENEIAQASGGFDDKHQPLASSFVHAEHLLVDGKKMSKSLKNFYTLRDVEEHGYHPLSFRFANAAVALSQPKFNFTWEALWRPL